MLPLYLKPTRYKYYFFADVPSWNDGEMSLNTGDEVFTKGGGYDWNSGQVHYSNFPYEVEKLLPMYGTTDIDTRQNNTLLLSRTMLSFMLQDTERDKMDMEGWEYLSSGKYLGPTYEEIDLYKKIIPKGSYMINNFNAMFLFSDGIAGKNGMRSLRHEMSKNGPLYLSLIHI